MRSSIGCGRPQASGDAGRDPDRPVGTGRHEPVHAERARQPVDRLLVLGGEDRPLVREHQADRVRVAVDGDHVHVVAAMRRFEEAELRRPRA